MAVRETPWGQTLLQRHRAPELEAIARKNGPVLGGSAYFSGVPWVYLGTVRLNQRLLSRVYLDHDLADLIGLVVSRDNSCRYCFAVQRALLRTVGIPEERIVALEETFLLSDFEAAERAALEFAQRLSRSNPLLRPDDVAPLRAAGYGLPEIREIAEIVGLNAFFNRISTLAALPPESWEALPDRWWSRLSRPLSARMVGRLRRRGEQAWLAEGEAAGPFEALVRAFDGHPFAGELRRTLDDLFESTILPPRAKALCFAVIGRALDCPLSQREAAAIAEDHGLASHELEEVLTHLASPALDELESLVVSFSRQTVWYQVPDLQRRARELSDRLDHEVFLELLFVVSFANVICRLGFLVELE